MEYKIAIKKSNNKDGNIVNLYSDGIVKMKTIFLI